MPRLLCVGDDTAIRELLREHLEGEYEVIETSDATQALTLALQRKPDAIVLDLMLPRLSGFDLCKTFSSLGLTQLIPIFVITAKPAAEYKEMCMNLGAWEYVEKPINFAQLKARLGAVVADKPKERRSAIRLQLSVALKLRGVDQSGVRFEQLTFTDNMSPSSFLCHCAASLHKDAIVEVFLGHGDQYFAGCAGVVRTERGGSPWQRYGFQFIERPRRWVLQETY